MVQEPLASVLRSGREHFNARFAEARRNFPRLEAVAFDDFVHATLDPLVAASPWPIEALSPVVQAGFEIGLELVGQNLAGKAARGNRLIEEAWRQLAPANWKLVASAPEHFFASISNAVHQLAADKTTRVSEWIAGMAQLAGQCPNLETWLKVGQVLAWRAGRAEWRSSALALAATLPEKLAKAAVGAPPRAPWAKVRERLAEDDWFDPKTGELDAKPSLRMGAKVGAFRGLGGLFAEPPIVTAAGGQLFVRSGESCWLLMADVFGHTFHNATRAEFDTALARAAPTTSVRISATTIEAGGAEMPNLVPGKVTSLAVLPHTLALTSSVSHAVFLFAY